MKNARDHHITSHHSNTRFGSFGLLCRPNIHARYFIVSLLRIVQNHTHRIRRVFVHFCKHIHRASFWFYWLRASVFVYVCMLGHGIFIPCIHTYDKFIYTDVVSNPFLLKLCLYLYDCLTFLSSRIESCAKILNIPW